MTKFCSGILAAMVFASAAGSAQAAGVTLHETNLGWFMDDGSRNASSTNMLTGVTSSGEETRSFFIFDITGLSGVVSGGSFSVAAGDGCDFATAGCLQTDEGTETVNFYDVLEADLVPLAASGSAAGDAAGKSVYEDLGSGESYGEVTIAGADRSAMPAVSLIFSERLIADLNAAIAAGDTSFAIGAALATIAGSYDDDEGFWSRSRPQMKVASLNIDFSSTVAAVPLPATLPLLIGGVAALGFAVRRMKLG